MAIDFDFSRRHHHHPPAPPPPVALPADSTVVSARGLEPPVSLRRPSTQSSESLICLGRSGSRKSTLMLQSYVRAIAYEYRHVAPGRRRSFAIIDFKDDLAEGLLAGLAAEVPQALENTYFLNPFSRNAGIFPYNLVHADACGTPNDMRARQIAHLVGRASGTGVLAVALGGRQLELIAALFHAIFECDHPSRSLAWAADALASSDGIGRLASLCRSERARRTLLSLRLPPDVLASTGTRIRSVLSAYQDLENMMSAPTCVNWRNLTSPGTVTICALGKPIGGALELAEFHGNVLVRQCIEFLLASRTSPTNQPPVTVAIDECQMAASAIHDCLRRVIETGRSRNVQVHLICQGTRALRDASGALFESLLTNCAYTFCGRLSSSDATLFCREALGPSIPAAAANRIAGELISLPPGEFFFSEGDGKPRRFRGAPPDLNAWRQASVSRAGDIAAVRRRLCPQPLPPATHLWDVASGPSAMPPTSWVDPRTPRQPRSRLG